MIKTKLQHRKVETTVDKTQEEAAICAHSKYIMQEIFQFSLTLISYYGWVTEAYNSCWQLADYTALFMAISVMLFANLMVCLKERVRATAQWAAGTY